MKKLAAMAFSLITVFSMTFFGFQPETYAWSENWTGTWPHKTKCVNDAITVQSASIDGDSVIELRYSPSCETIWARITADYPHDPNRGLGTAKIIRNSDGCTYSCDIPVGESFCFTQQVNDHNVTSYAYGKHDNGRYFHEARTASY